MFINDDVRAHKVKQLSAMIEREDSDELEDNAYGAHLSHWSGCAAPINIDGEALEVLRNYYDHTPHCWLLTYGYKQRNGEIKLITRTFYDAEELEAYKDKLEKGIDSGRYLQSYSTTVICGLPR